MPKFRGVGKVTPIAVTLQSLNSWIRPKSSQHLKRCLHVGSGAGVLEFFHWPLKSHQARPVELNIALSGIGSIPIQLLAQGWGTRINQPPPVARLRTSFTAKKTIFFARAPAGLRFFWVLLADQRGIEPPPAVCQRHKSAAIPTAPQHHEDDSALQRDQSGYKRSHLHSNSTQAGGSVDANRLRLKSRLVVLD